jgi:hypothetical protein
LAKLFAAAIFYVPTCGKGELFDMEILIGFLSITSTILALIEPFSKNMKTVLVFNFLVNAMVGVNYLLSQSYSGALICGVAILCLGINYYFTSREQKIPRWAVAVEAVIFLAANLLTFAYLYDVLALIASLLFVLYIAQTSTKYYRLIYIANSLIWIPYDFFAKSYGNLFTHVVLAIAILVSILVRDRKKPN